MPPPRAQSAITATLAAINPTVQISADTAAYVWLKSNATADVLVRPHAKNIQCYMPGAVCAAERSHVVMQCKCLSGVVLPHRGMHP